MKHIEVYHIQDDVPIPVHVPSTGQLRLLKVGQSFIFPIADRGKVQVYASKLKQRYGREFTIRKQNDTYCRVWRQR